MRKMRIRILATALLGAGLLSAAGGTQEQARSAPPEQTGLLLIVHGSGSSAWNDKMRALETEVAAKADSAGLAGARLAFMEMAHPTIAEAERALERQGCARIVAVPLFSVPSGHSQFDIPSILGLYHDSTVKSHLAAEGIECVQPAVPLGITAPLACSPVIHELLLDRLREISTVPQQEALVLLVHGADDFAAFWDRLAVDFGARACAATGISRYEWAAVGVGQEFAGRAVPAIRRAAQGNRRVLLLAAHLGLSASDLLERYRSKSRSDALEGIEVVAGRRALVPDPRIVDWVIDSAVRAAAPR